MAWVVEIWGVTYDSSAPTREYQGKLSVIPSEKSSTAYPAQFCMLNTNLVLVFRFDENLMSSSKKSDFPHIDQHTMWSSQSPPPSFLRLIFICQKMGLDNIYI